MLIRRHASLGISFRVLLFVGALLVTPSPLWPAEDLPARLTDEQFWQIVTDFSEDGGVFQFDNFMSNEDALQWVIPELKQRTRPGGVFVGVGPEQNFTYLAALESKMAFIIDIRRQNMLEHLLYKALFELSLDRADFLSRLFSRKRPPGLDSNSSAEALFQGFKPIPADRNLLDENKRAVVAHLIEGHLFQLSQDDLDRMAYVYDAFFEGGPDLSYASTGFYNGGQITYAGLMTAADQRGERRSFLATEESFRFVQDLQKKNLIVPLVGDFAGNKAINKVAQYLKEHDATLTAFYASNVEQYLFQNTEAWKRFYMNVAALPLDASSTLIRSFTPLPGGMWFSTLSSITEGLKAFNEGRIRSYADIMPR
jgi:hypothetical protein